MDTSDDAIDRWFASFATRLKPGHVIEPMRRPLAEKDLVAKVRAGASLARSEEGRFAFLPKKSGVRLYVAGVEIDVARDAAPLAKLVCQKRRFDGKEILAVAKAPAARALLTRLVADGALVLQRARRASSR
jgi:ribosomal protein L16 Arg81 hydroxylase